MRRVKSFGTGWSEVQKAPRGLARYAYITHGDDLNNNNNNNKLNFWEELKNLDAYQIVKLELTHSQDLDGRWPSSFNRSQSHEFLPTFRMVKPSWSHNQVVVWVISI